MSDPDIWNRKWGSRMLHTEFHIPPLRVRIPSEEQNCNYVVTSTSSWNHGIIFVIYITLRPVLMVRSRTAAKVHHFCKVRLLVCTFFSRYNRLLWYFRYPTQRVPQYQLLHYFAITKHIHNLTAINFDGANFVQ